GHAGEGGSSRRIGAGSVASEVPLARRIDPGERMKVDFRYLGHSGVLQRPSGAALAFAPNLARPKVFFDAELAAPVRFREAVSALHDVVVGDLKAKKKDKSAWEAW